VDVALIAVPYHLGHLSVGMGAGPDRLLDGGVGDALRGNGHEVEVVRVSLDPQPNEVAALFATAGLVSRHVAGAVDRGAFPLVLSGNCFCSLGTAAAGGLRASDVSSAIDAIGRLLAVRAAAVTAYDPTLDPDGSLAETAVELVARIVDTASVKRADRVSA
jgi:arginase family enzyme